MKRIFIILFLVLFCIGCSKENLSNDLAFDSGVWKEANKRMRGRMSTRLIDSKLLIGKTKSEIEEMLGKPDLEGEKLWIYEVNIGEILDHQFNVFLDEKNGKVFLNYVAN